MANGLPSSKTQPLMGKLEPVKNVIVHKLTVKWGKHEPESKFQRKTERWRRNEKVSFFVNNWAFGCNDGSGQNKVKEF
ncbi:MAG: hypothetical protein IIB09_07430 [Bacteroidetes bacterium]|nr:hypothetical protein [Bacteroidota bacterium]